MKTLAWVLVLLLTILTNLVTISYIFKLVNVPNTGVFMLGMILMLASVFGFSYLYTKIVKQIEKINKK